MPMRYKRAALTRVLEPARMLGSQSSAPEPGADRYGVTLPVGHWTSPVVEAGLIQDAAGRPALVLQETTGWELGEHSLYPPFAVRAKHRNDAYVLQRFLALGSASDRDILRFAQRFGAFDFCVHYQALGHKLHSPFNRPGEDGRIYLGLRRTGEVCGERLLLQPTELYRLLARRVYEALVLATALRQDEPLAAELAVTLRRSGASFPSLIPSPFNWDEAPPHFRPRTSPPTPGEARGLVSSEVQWWIGWGGVMPSLTWDDEGRPGAIFKGQGLQGAIARQLCFRIIGMDALAFCSACGQPFTPRRRPRKRERSWCEQEACQQERGRQALRDHRARERSSRA